jgi:hypothetical protein
MICRPESREVHVRSRGHVEVGGRSARSLDPLEKVLTKLRRPLIDDSTDTLATGQGVPMLQGHKISSIHWQISDTTICNSMRPRETNS